MECKELPGTYVIFVCENDIFECGLPMYHVERVVQETKKRFNDKAHILYINGQYRGGDDMGRLMEDFFPADLSEMNFKELADRAKYFKETEKGAESMSDIVMEFYEVLRERDRKQIALALIAGGETSLAGIAKATGLSLAEVEELAKKKSA